MKLNWRGAHAPRQYFLYKENYPERGIESAIHYSDKRPRLYNAEQQYQLCKRSTERKLGPPWPIAKRALEAIEIGASLGNLSTGKLGGDLAELAAELC